MGSSLAQVSVIVGAFLPLLIAMIQKAHFPGWARTTIGLVMSFGTAAITAYLQHKLDLHTWAVSAIFVTGAAMLTYRSVWVPIGAAPWIEDAVNGSNKASARAKRTARRQHGK